MKKKKIFYLLILIFFNNSSLNSQILNNLRSSYESYSAYYIDDSKTGDFNYEDRFRSNNYLNLKSNIGASWNFELQIESYLPSSLLNYSPDFKNTGISTLISPYGEEIIKIPLNKEGVKTTKLMSRLDETIYKKFGDYIFIISILFILLINRLIGLKNNFIRV